MKTKKSYFSKALVLLMAVMMVFTMMPSMAFADVNSTAEETFPITLKTGETVLTAVDTGEDLATDYNGSASIYEVAVTPGTENVTVSGYSGGNMLVYNYDAEGNWLAGYYTADENGEISGTAEETVQVDVNGNHVADYIWVQTPYVKAEGDAWASSSLICVIKFVYELPVEVTTGGLTITTTDTWIKDGYSYADAYSSDKSDLYILHVAEGTTEATIEKKNKAAFLAYNYGKTGYLAGAYDDLTAGVVSATVKVDDNSDGSADYIRIQNSYRKDGEVWSGGELLYTLQFVVEGGLPGTSGTIPALSDFEQQEAAKKVVDSLGKKTEYCTNSDWITAFYASGGTLSQENINAYLKKVYGDIVTSAQLGTIAKDVIALTAMGYDPTKIADAAGNNYNLLEQLYNANIADLGSYGIYTAPYILLAYDSFDFVLPADASLGRETLIDYMIKAQASDGSWGGYTYGGTEYPGTAGDTASVAQALLPYAEENAKVKIAVEKANRFIENNLETSKDSTNYLAVITLYEALQDKKASELVVEQATGTNVIDHMLSYKLSDDTFGYQNNTSTNESATVEAYKALVAYKNLTDGNSATTANIYNSQGRYWNGLQAVTGLPAIKDTLSDIFITAPKKLAYKTGESIDLTGLTVTAQTIGGDKKEIATVGITANPTEITTGTQLSYSGFDTATTGTKTVTVKYEEFDAFLNQTIAKTAQFIITVTATDGSSETPIKTVSIAVYDDAGKSIVKDSSYTVSAGNTTVMDVLKAVLGNAGKTYVLKSTGDYIASIDGLGEFDKGQNSGWMYKVNGSLPDVAANQYKLNGGETIEWFYTKDWTTVPGATGGATEEVKDVTTDTKTGTTTAPTEVKVTEKTNADGTKTKVAEVKVSADNQKEILKQAKANKSKEIILNVSKTAAQDATKADVTLDKSFIDSIVKDTDAKLTVKTPFGDKTYTQDELKALSAAATGSTVTIAVEKAAEEPTINAKELAAKLTPVARSAKTAKKNVKVTVSLDKQDKEILSQLTEAGYTVKYRFYRSTKKSAGYKSTLTKKTTTYTNTSGKKGMKYFYKVQVRVYDENGKLVATTALKQCKYATRTWSK